MDAMTAEKTKTRTKPDTRIIGELAPIGGLVLVLVVFTLLTGGALLSTQNLQSLSSQVITTSLVTIGAVFVFGSGYFDMSLGGCLCFTAVIGGEVAIATGSLLLSFLAIVGVSLIFGIAKGIFATTVNVPFFIFTIVLGSVISAVVLVMLGSESTIYLKDAVKEIPTLSFEQMTAVNIVALVLFFVVCLVLFNYTPLGVCIKNLGGSFIAARQSGINTRKITIISFIVSSLGVAIAAFIILLRTRTVGATTASGVGNDVMVALVLGGMPLSGGPKSKISAGLIGAITITLLNSGLTIMGLDTGQIQVVRGVVFIAVVFLSSFSYRGKLLPR